MHERRQQCCDRCDAVVKSRDCVISPCNFSGANLRGHPVTRPSSPKRTKRIPQIVRFIGGVPYMVDRDKNLKHSTPGFATIDQRRRFDKMRDVELPKHWSISPHEELLDHMAHPQLCCSCFTLRNGSRTASSVGIVLQ